MSFSRSSLPKGLRATTSAFGAVLILTTIGCSGPDAAAPADGASASAPASAPVPAVVQTVRAAEQGAQAMQVAGNLRESVLNDLSSRLDQQHGSGG